MCTFNPNLFFSQMAANDFRKKYFNFNREQNYKKNIMLGNKLKNPFIFLSVGAKNNIKWNKTANQIINSNKI